MKRLVLFISLLTLLSSSITLAKADEIFKCGPNETPKLFTYSVHNGVLMPRGGCAGDLNIDDSVVEIGPYAFSNNAMLGQVTVPESVTKIDEEAFAFANGSVTLPDSVLEIGPRAFFGSTMTTVKLPSRLQAISDGLFRNSQLTSVSIPQSVSTIGAQAFNNTKLTSILIPKSVISIGSGAFANIATLPTMVIPDSVKNIGYGAFAGSQISSITLPNTLKSITDSMLAGTALETVEIPQTVETIADWAFGNSPLKHIEIPPSVKSIGSWSFQGTSLVSIVLKDTLKSIGQYAFAHIPTLTSVFLPRDVQIDARSNLDLFEGDSALTEIHYCGKMDFKPMKVVCDTPDPTPILVRTPPADQGMKYSGEIKKVAPQKSIVCINARTSKKLVLKTGKCPKGYSLKK